MWSFSRRPTKPSTWDNSQTSWDDSYSCMLSSKTLHVAHVMTFIWWQSKFVVPICRRQIVSIAKCQILSFTLAHVHFQILWIHVFLQFCFQFSSPPCLLFRGGLLTISVYTNNLVAIVCIGYIQLRDSGGRKESATSQEESNPLQCHSIQSVHTCLRPHKSGMWTQTWVSWFPFDGINLTSIPHYNFHNFLHWIFQLRRL